jgi:aminoglycoside phosphotransferase (APT) family kinase protein
MNADYTDAKINQLLGHAGLGRADEIRYLGQGVHNDAYYARVGQQEYCIRIARYEGKRGLAREADALRRLPGGIAPELIYFEFKTDPIDSLWSITSYLTGSSPKRLTIPQCKSLGFKLARVHAIPAPDGDVVDEGEVTGDKSNLWKYLLWSCRSFYPPDEALSDDRLADLMQKVQPWFTEQQKQLTFPAEKHLLHKDVGVGNMVVKDDEVFIIDWEDREFGDPMSDFVTGFWDIEQAGRIVLSPEERKALFEGYAIGGGVVDETRLEVWTVFDKLVVALFFHNRMYSPKDDTNPEQQAEYKKNLDAIVASLQDKF